MKEQNFRRIKLAPTEDKPGTFPPETVSLLRLVEVPTNQEKYKTDSTNSHAENLKLNHL
jgi:hypothetical protein